MAQEIVLKSECTVLTYKEGLLSRVAHDLKLRFEKHRFVWTPDANRLHASFDTTSLRVVCARSNGADTPGVLTDKDKRKIEQSIRNDVLRTNRNPSASLDGALNMDDKRARFNGHLELCGVRRPLELEACLDGRWSAHHRLDQTHFGIKPFSAALGTLKIKPEVDIHVSIEVVDPQ